MKKTLTVNLGGSVFHIDEDAYQLLEKYLSNLRVHFKKEEGSDEIMNDFEMRISELLGERIKLGFEVITIEHVEEVIKRMGKPEEIFDTEGEKEFASEEGKTHTTSTGRKRFYRDPDDKILGGVAGGFAAYMDWDPSAVRIGLFVLCFFWGVMIPIYFILWLIIPLARTAAEKLEMRGERVTIENIGKTVTDGFEKVSNNVNDYVNSGKPRTTLQKLADAFVTVVGALVKVALILLAIIVIPPLLLALFIFVVVAFALIFGGGFGILYHLMPMADWGTIQAYPESALIGASVAMFVLIAIPVVSLLYGLCSAVFKFKPMPAVLKWTFLILWIIAAIGFVSIGWTFGWPDFYQMTNWPVNWNSVSISLW